MTFPTILNIVTVGAAFVAALVSYMLAVAFQRAIDATTLESSATMFSRGVVRHAIVTILFCGVATSIVLYHEDIVFVKLVFLFGFGISAYEGRRLLQLVVNTIPDEYREGWNWWSVAWYPRRRWLCTAIETLFRGAF